MINFFNKYKGMIGIIVGLIFYFVVTIIYKIYFK
jgi:hypothetical protein